jgi:hypothetical protein
MDFNVLCFNAFKNAYKCLVGKVKKEVVLSNVPIHACIVL